MNISNYDNFVAGGLAGFYTRLLCQPLDVIKIRFQLQHEPISTKYGVDSKYTSLLQTFKKIISEERVFALWKGHIPGQILSILYGSVQFSVYDYSSTLYKLYFPNAYGNEFFSGAISGSIASFVSMPFDVVRTRFVAQNPKKLQSLLNAFVWIWKHEGPKGLFRGSLPAQISIIPSMGLTFSLYYYFINTLDLTKDFTLYRSFMAGISGLIAKLAVYPLDLVKKRLQLQGFQEYRQGFGKNYYYTGMLHTFLSVYKSESSLSFFKGLLPTLIKSFVTTSLYFTFYEASLKILRLYNNSVNYEKK